MAAKRAAKRNLWSKEHVSALRSYSKARTPVSKIAKEMRRSESAVRQKATSIGISVGHQR